MNIQSIKSLLNDVRFFWLILALPAIPMVMALLGGTELERLLHPTGEFSARFMILAMLITPLQLAFKKAKWLRWLMRRRRAIGVAAFFYALAHTVLYVADMASLAAVVDEIGLPGIWTGWIAMIIFIPLAITSNNLMVRLLKTKWKSLQRLVYVAAVFTLIHWILIHNNIGPALVNFAPLALAQAYRLYHWKSHSNPVHAQTTTH